MSVEQDEEFVSFVADNSSRLLTAAWMLTGDPHTAEELVQEAMVRVYLKWGRVRKGQPKAYARKIVVNLHTDRWRSRRKEVLTDAVPEGAKGRESHHVDLVRALQSLPTREREVVVLRHYLDQSERATADALGIGVGTVKASGSRGLVRLRALLEGDESHANL
ncbi:MAG: SigE family RNA polymerase sigma factor [Ornithinimicrobium sp.]